VKVHLHSILCNNCHLFWISRDATLLHLASLQSLLYSIFILSSLCHFSRRNKETLYYIGFSIPLRRNIKCTCILGLNEHRVVHLKKWVGYFEVFTAFLICCGSTLPYLFQHEVRLSLSFVTQITTGKGGGDEYTVCLTFLSNHFCSLLFLLRAALIRNPFKLCSIDIVL